MDERIDVNMSRIPQSDTSFGSEAKLLVNRR